MRKILDTTGCNPVRVGNIGGYLRYTEIQSNRIFVTVECLYGFKAALGDGIQRIVKP